MLPASIPPPPLQSFHLGPLTIRLYALCVILGVVLAVVIAERRWQARGGRKGTPTDLAVYAVPAGLIGARIYHVITDPELYFGPGRDWVGIFKIWDGGLGIWGAVAGGALAVYVVARHRRLAFAALADAAAPGIVVAQAVGRWGNYFNQELFGGHTSLPWALHVTNAEGAHAAGFYQPTFLYESIWDLGVAGLVIWADRRWRLGRGRAFALYVAAYTAGRGWIEALRVDHANHYLGLRLNDWVSIGVFLAAAAYLLLRRGERESVVEPAGEDESAIEHGAAEEDSAAAVDPATQPPETAGTTSYERANAPPPAGLNAEPSPRRPVP
jgi:prolipoprotein diacylglyceryl transferase